MKDDWKKAIRECWGGRLVRFERSDLVRLELRPDDAEILEDVGLPNVDFNFVLNFRVADRPQTVGGRYVVLGDNSGALRLGAYVALDRTTSEIVKLDVDGLGQGGSLEGVKETDVTQTLFINSDLASFLSCTTRFYEFLNTYAALPEDEWQICKEAAMVDLKSSFSSIDSRALFANGYWEFVVSDVEID